MSTGPGPAHHSHSVLVARVVGLGRCVTWTRRTVPVTMGAWSCPAQCPRRVVGATEPLPVAAGPAGGARLGRRGVGVEDAVVADADHDLGAGVGQLVAERGRVVAGVEDEHRRRSVGGQQVDQAADLGHGGGGGVGAGRDAHRVQRGGPGIHGPVQLGDPLI